MTDTPPPAQLKAQTVDTRTDRIVADDDGIRLDRWFKRHRDDIPHALIARWARTGLIRLDGAKVGPAERLASGQTLVTPIATATPAHGRIATPRRPLSAEEEALADSMLIHQDGAAILLNKPPGLATQGGTGTTQHVDGLLDAYATGAGRPKLVHRLDKDTSGVLLVARTAAAAAKFSRSFSSRTARKTYWAIVTGVPDIAAGMIDLPISKQPGSGGEKMHVDTENGQSARTRYRMIERAGNAAAWLELQPLTGRTHQLRVHLAAIGHPIVGDGKYGGKLAFLTGTISRKMHLHARHLLIDHPVGGQLEATAELPPHFEETLTALGFDIANGNALIGAPGPHERVDDPDAKVRSQAREARRARKGERRARGDVPAKPGGRAGTKDRPKPRGKAKPAAGAVGGKSAAPPRRAPARPPASARPASARPATPRPRAR